MTDILLAAMFGVLLALVISRLFGEKTPPPETPEYGPVTKLFNPRSVVQLSPGFDPPDTFEKHEEAWKKQNGKEDRT